MPQDLYSLFGIEKEKFSPGTATGGISVSPTTGASDDSWAGLSNKYRNDAAARRVDQIRLLQAERENPENSEEDNRNLDVALAKLEGTTPLAGKDVKSSPDSIYALFEMEPSAAQVESIYDVFGVTPGEEEPPVVKDTPAGASGLGAVIGRAVPGSAEVVPSSVIGKKNAPSVQSMKDSGKAAPYSDKYLQGVKQDYEAATPEARDAIAKKDTRQGLLTGELNQQYDAAGDLGSTDGRLEKRTAWWRAQGATEKNAAVAAKRDLGMDIDPTELASVQDSRRVRKEYMASKGFDLDEIEAMNPVARGFEVTFRQLPMLAAGATSLVGATLESVLGEDGVSSAVKDWSIEKYKAGEEEVGFFTQENDSATKAWEKAKEGDYAALADFLGYGLGYAGGQAAQMLTGTKALSLTAKGAMKVGGAKLLPRMVQAEIATIKRAIPLASRSALAPEELQKMAVRNLSQKIGDAAALSTMALGMEAGEIGGDLTSRAQAEGRSLTGAEIARAWGASVAAAVPEYMQDKFTLKAMRGKAGMPGGPAVETAATAGVAGAGGFATEFTQTYIEEVGKQGHAKPGTFSEAIDAAWLGAVGEGGPAAAGTALPHVIGATRSPLDNAAREMYQQVGRAQFPDDANRIAANILDPRYAQRVVIPPAAPKPTIANVLDENATVDESIAAAQEMVSAPVETTGDTNDMVERALANIKQLTQDDTVIDDDGTEYQYVPGEAGQMPGLLDMDGMRLPDELAAPLLASDEMMQRVLERRQPTQPTEVADGGTDYSGQVPALAAEGYQGAGLNVPGSGGAPQTGLLGGLAGGSGSTTVPGATDGSPVPAGNAGVQSVTTPTTPLPESGATPLVTQAVPASLPVESAAPSYEIKADEPTGDVGSSLHTLTKSDAGRKAAATVLTGDVNADEKINLLAIAEVASRQNMPIDTDHMRSPKLAETGWSAHSVITGEPVAPQPESLATQEGQTQSPEVAAEGVVPVQRDKNGYAMVNGMFITPFDNKFVIRESTGSREKPHRMFDSEAAAIAALMPPAATVTPAQQKVVDDVNASLVAEREKMGDKAAPLQVLTVATPEQMTPAVRDALPLAEAFLQAAGYQHEMVVAKGDGTLDFDGVVSANGAGIVIAADSVRPVPRVVAHEFGHELKKEAPTVWRTMADEILNRTDKAAQLAHVKKRGYAGDKMNAEQAEEFVNDVLSDMLHDGKQGPRILVEVASNMDKAEPGSGKDFLKRLLDFIDKVIKGMVGKGYGTEAAINKSELGAIRKAIAKALTDYNLQAKKAEKAAKATEAAAAKKAALAAEVERAKAKPVAPTYENYEDSYNRPTPSGSKERGYKIIGGEKFSPSDRIAHATKQRDLLVNESKALRSSAANAPMTGSQFETRNNRAKKADTLANNKALIEAWNEEIAKAKSVDVAAEDMRKKRDPVDAKIAPKSADETPPTAKPVEVAPPADTKTDEVSDADEAKTDEEPAVFARGDRFTDGQGNTWEVWNARTSLVEAFPVIDGKIRVNNQDGQRWATDARARSANPEARMDFTPVVVPDAAPVEDKAKPQDPAPRNMKEAREWLYRRIDEAMQDAPKRGDKVERIQITKLGTVELTEQALDAAEIKAKAIKGVRDGREARNAVTAAMKQNHKKIGDILGFVTFSIPNTSIKFNVLNSKEDLAKFKDKLQKATGAFKVTEKITPNGPQPGGPKRSLRNPAVDELNAKLLEQEGIENAFVPSEMGDPGIIDAFKKVFNVEIVPIAGRMDFLGMQFNGRLYVNAEHPNAGFVHIAGHELLHDMAKKQPGIYNVFEVRARDYLRLGAESVYAQRLMEVGDSPGTDTYQEILADFVGDALSDQAFLQFLADENPTQFRVFVNTVISWLNKVAEKLKLYDLHSSDYFKDVTGLQVYLAKTLSEYSATQVVPEYTGVKRSNRNPDIRRSLRNVITQDTRDALIKGWTQIGGADTAFTYPRSESKSLGEIMLKVAPRLEVVSMDGDVDLEKAWIVYAKDTDGNADKAHPGYVMQYKDGKIELNVAQWGEGNDGAALYAAAGNFAYNNGLLFAGDRMGISDTGRARRLENMISLALKYKTTRHIEPHVDMLVDFSWKEGDDNYNLGEMLAASYRLTAEVAPEIEDIVYGPDTKEFAWLPTANREPAGEPDGERAGTAGGYNANFDERGTRRVKPNIDAIALAARKRGGRLGRKTLIRAILSNTFARGAQANERTGERAGEMVVPEDVTAKVLYSKRDTITIDGQERPTTNSNGKPIAQTEEGLRNFWEWFADSAVVDEQGRPLVVYHGTNKDFSVFSNAYAGKTWEMFSDNPDYANRFAQDKGAVVYQTMLSLKNPLDLSSLPAMRGDARNKLLDLLEDAGVDVDKKTLPYERDLYQIINIAGHHTNFKERVQAAGYDGIIMPDNHEGAAPGDDTVYATTYIAFSPTQIKSATGNDGGFDGSNPDIRRSLRDKDTDEELARKLSHALAGYEQRLQPAIEQMLNQANDDWNALKGYVIPHKDSEAAGEAIARTTGIGIEQITEMLKTGSVDVNGEARHPVEILAAAMATVRINMAQLVDAENADDMAQRLTDVMNLMLAIRTDLSETGRALGYAGYAQMKNGAMGLGLAAQAEGKPEVKAADKVAEDADKEAVKAEKDAVDAIEDLTKKDGGAFKATMEAEQAENSAEDKDAEATDVEQAATDKKQEAQKKREVAKLSKDKAKTATGKAKLDAEAEAAISEQEASEAELKALSFETHAKNLRREAGKMRSDAKAARKRAEAALVKGRLKKQDAEVWSADAKRKMDRAKKLRAEAIAQKKEAMRVRAQAQRLIAKSHGAITQAKMQADKANRAIKKMRYSLTKERILEAMGGEAEMQKIFDELKRQGHDVDLHGVTMLFQGMAGHQLLAMKNEEKGLAGPWSNRLGQANRVGGMAAELFKAYILSRLSTHALNVMSTWLHRALEMRVTKAIAEMMPGGVGAKKHWQVMRALTGVHASAMTAMNFALSAESRSEQMIKLLKMNAKDQKMVIDLTNNKWMDNQDRYLPGQFGKVVRNVGFTPLGAEDSYLKAFPYLYSLALQEAEGRPIDYQEAVEYAETIAFQSHLSGFGQWINTIIKKVPVLGTHIPFITTLENLIVSSLKYTPGVGLVFAGFNQMALEQAIASGDGMKIRRAIDMRNMALARSIVGGVFGLLTILAYSGDDDDELTGLRPVDMNEFAIWRQENGALAIRLGDYNVSFEKFDPIASSVGLTVSMVNAVNALTDDNEDTTALGALGQGIHQMLISKHFMEQFVTMLGSLGKKDGGEKAVTNYYANLLSAMTIPGAIAQFAEVPDEFSRETKADRNSDTPFLDAYLNKTAAKMPGMRDDLDAALDVWGQPADNPGYMNPAPVRPVKARIDPLNDWLLKMGKTVQARPLSLDGMPVEVKQELLRKRHDMLTKLMNNTNGLTRGEKKDKISNTIGKWTRTYVTPARARLSLEKMEDPNDAIVD